MTTRIDAAEALLGAVFLVVAVLSLAGISLAEMGALTRGALAIAGVLASAGVLGWARRSVIRSGGVARTSRRDWAMLGAVFAVSAGLLLPPMEAIVDAGDASVYLAIGQMVADEHSLRPLDAVASSFTPGVRERLFARDPVPPPLFNYFPGGLQLTDDARIQPGFFHLAPVWMAVLDLMFGPRGGPFTGVFFAALSIPLAWAIGRRLSGSWTGVAAAALILANFGEQHFARWPCSEIVAQYFSLAAVWWLTLSIDDDRSAWVSIAAGVAIGLGAFARVDALLITALPVLVWLAAAAVIERAGRRARVIALLTAAIVTTYAIAHAWWFSNAYSRRVLAVLWWIRIRHPPLVRGAVGAAALGFLYFACARGGPWMRRIAVVAAVLGATGVLLAGSARAMHSASAIDPLLTGPGIALAFAGLVALLVRLPIVRVMPLTVVFLGSAMLYLQYWADSTGGLLVLRRSVPVLLPLGAVLMACAFATIARAGAPLRWLAVAGVAGFVLAFGSMSRVVFAERVYGGTYENVAAIARALPENSLTIADPQTPSHLALALRYQFGRSVVLVSGQADEGALARVAQQALAQHRPVRLLVPSSREARSLLPGQLAPMTIRALDQLSLRIRELDPTSRKLPGRLIAVTRELETYAIEPPAAAPLPIVMNLGPRDFPFAGLGWHPVETMQSVSARWTDGAGQLMMPVVDQAPELVTVVVFAAGTRPAGFAPPTVQLSIGAVVLGSFAARAPGVAEYRLALSREQTAALCRGGSLLIQSDAFVPARVSNSSDRRRLGIAVDRVEVIKSL